MNSEQPEKEPQWGTLPQYSAEQVKQAFAEAGIPLTPELLWDLTHLSEAMLPIEQLLTELDEMVKHGDQGAA
jgi:hypothetical protein